MEVWGAGRSSECLQDAGVSTTLRIGEAVLRAPSSHARVERAIGINLPALLEALANDQGSLRSAGEATEAHTASPVALLVAAALAQGLES